LVEEQGTKALTILKAGMQNGTVRLANVLTSPKGRSQAVDSERSWKGPVLPLLVPLLNPFSRAKGPVVLGEFVTVTSIVPFGVHTPVVLYIASKTMPCLVCRRETEVRRCCFYLNLACISK
jgi:hypothetical protein